MRSGPHSPIVLAVFALALATARATEVEFNRDVRPILADHCFRCHGPDSAQRKANLRLDQRDSAIAREAIVPGRPDESGIVMRIRERDPEAVMPPSDLHKPLSESQRSTLEKWIASGARYQAHWAYVPPTRTPPPRTDVAPIDAFIEARLASNGITPSPQADPVTLLRRLSLDLIGLPPTPEEIADFVSDPSDAAYERAVDRLLASPHYGERMAVPWLDLVRYADTVGYHGDQNLHAFPYRDYVVDAFNADKPFDRFATEQLAGDLLPNPTAEQLTATAFLRLNMVTREGGAQDKEYLAKYAADRVRTFGTAFLGSTIGCAECHDHKYDPFQTRDFYRLAAFFSDLVQWGVYTDYAYTPNPDLAGFTNDHPFPPEIDVESPYLKARIHTLRTAIGERAQRALAEANDEAQHALTAWCEARRPFLTAHVDGFASGTQTVLEPAGRAPREDGAIVFEAGDPEKLRIEIAPTDRYLGSVRFDLLPEGENGILRQGNDAFLRFAFALRTMKDGKAEDAPLRVRRGEATEYQPRYSNGHEIRGIVGGWSLRVKDPKRSLSACFQLERPFELPEGSTVVVTVEGNRARALRVRTSPFASCDPLAFDDIARLREPLTSPTPWSDPWTVAIGLRSSAFDREAFHELVTLDRSLRECDGGLAKVVIAKAREPRETRVLPRGDWQNESGEVVLPGVPSFLPQIATAPDQRATRLDLAAWLFAPENPLPARVFVNRLWKQLFGTALSAVVDDVGMQGEAPSHPELLDWLACEFRDSGFHVKSIVKQIVMSETYRRDSARRVDLADIDPGNRLLAAQNPRRLDAEFVRDNALAISGLLDSTLGGPPAMPWQPPRLYEHLQFPDRDYYPDRDERQWRRGLYAHWQRTFLHPMLANFDAPSREECSAARTLANTPQQALTLLNDDTFVEAAHAFAASLLSDSRLADDRARIDEALLRARGRIGTPAEHAILTRTLSEARSRFQADEKARDAFLGIGLSRRTDRALDRTELAALAVVTRVILNLHECITRN